MSKVLYSILQISKLELRHLKEFEIILKKTMTFKVFVDIQIIFYGTSPNYLESRAGKITSRERSSSSKTVTVTA